MQEQQTQGKAKKNRTQRISTERVKHAQATNAATVADSVPNHTNLEGIKPYSIAATASLFGATQTIRIGIHYRVLSLVQQLAQECSERVK